MGGSRDFETVDTVVIGAGQAGLTTSYWLGPAGVEHRLFERRSTPGGSWQDRWDSFCLNTPNWAIDLPGMPYSGPDPDGFMPRDDVVALLRQYAAQIGAPIQPDTDVTRVSPADGGFTVETSQGNYFVHKVVAAAGAYPNPKIPTEAAGVPPHVRQLHIGEYRNPGLLPGGAVLIVGSGQSGGQIAEDLLEAGRDVHLAISSCPESPRRYRGKDALYWILNLSLRGSRYGTTIPVPPPGARFACNPLLSGRDGGRDICLRDLARRGVQLHGHFEGTDDGVLVFSNDVEQRLAVVEGGFEQRFRPLIDAYIAASGIDAPPDDRPPHEGFVPRTEARLDLDAAGVGAIIWATGFRLDFGWLDVPVLDEFGYPRQAGGVTEKEGLYVVGLPWLTSHASPLLCGVGRDAERVAAHVAGAAAQAF